MTLTLRMLSRAYFVCLFHNLILGITPLIGADLTYRWANFGIFFNHGQCCCAGSRIYVQAGIYDKFVEQFKARAKANKVGDPFSADTFQGPQVSQLQYDRIMGYIDEG